MKFKWNMKKTLKIIVLFVCSIVFISQISGVCKANDGKETEQIKRLDNYYAYLYYETEIESYRIVGLVERNDGFYLTNDLEISGYVETYNNGMKCVKVSFLPLKKGVYVLGMQNAISGEWIALTNRLEVIPSNGFVYVLRIMEGLFVVPFKMLVIIPVKGLLKGLFESPFITLSFDSIFSFFKNNLLLCIFIIIIITMASIIGIAQIKKISSSKFKWPYFVNAFLSFFSTLLLFLYFGRKTGFYSIKTGINSFCLSVLFWACIIACIGFCIALIIGFIKKILKPADLIKFISIDFLMIAGFFVIPFVSLLLLIVYLLYLFMGFSNMAYKGLENYFPGNNYIVKN